MKTPAKLFYLFLALSVLASACGKPSYTVAESGKSRVTDLDIPAADLTTLVDGNNAFALDVYRSLRSETGNLILSPFSMSLALAMTYAGARGETESQMAQVLHFTQPQETLHPAFNALDLALEKKPLNLNKDQEPMTLNIANSVWAEQTFPFQQDFLDTIALNYGAGVNLTDFKTQFEPARKDINTWVEDKTNNKIKNLLPEGSLNADTRMVLVNAIYFKADWLNQFDANLTYDAKFNLLDGSQSDVKMMSDHLFIPYYAGDGFQAVELAYAGETAAMDIILPDEGNFEAFDSSFSKETYDAMVSGFQPTSLSLGLPKFSFTKDFSLSDTLKGMGMSDAFDADLADFSGMTGKKDLFISNVIHKAFVAVDEKGTEAAAATAVIMELAGAIMPDKIFTADRPFIFVIRDTVNGQILFVGRVMNPAE
jgi:serpin B